MKGLVLKDLYNIKFQLIGGILIFLYSNVMTCFIAAGEDVNLPKAAQTLPYAAVNYITIAACSAFVLNTFIDDFKSGWAKMQRTMPISNSQIVGGKLIVTAIVLSILMMLSLICNIISALLGNIPLEPMITIPIVITLLQMITLCVPTVAGYKSQTRLIMPIFLTITALVVILGVLLIFLTMNGHISLNTLRIIGYAAVPSVTAIVVPICVKAANMAVSGDI